MVEGRKIKYKKKSHADYVELIQLTKFLLEIRIEKDFNYDYWVDFMEMDIVKEMLKLVKRTFKKYNL